MPRGGPRPGFGGKQPGAGRPKRTPPPEVIQPRPRFESSRDFGVWALNAPDAEVSMDQKIRAMQVLAMLEGKQAQPAKPEPAEVVESGGRYAPRRVKGFGVVDGGR